MFPFKKMGPIDHNDRKPLVFAVLFSCLFLIIFSMAHPLSRRPAFRNENLKVPPPALPSRVPDPPEVESEPLAESRIPPKFFQQIDFTNRSYGKYTLSDGSKIDLKLRQRELQLPDQSSWFALNDVYYTDLTGDGKAEAIVWLNHVTCGGSCDGGRSLFYVFTENSGKLQQIWQYETGSYAYGCGLASLNAGGNTRIVLEMFGRCSKPGMEYPGPAKFTVKDITFIMFEYNGRRFVQKQIEFYDSSPINLQNYYPTMRIY